MSAAARRLPAVRLRRPELSNAEEVLEAIRESSREISRWMIWCHPAYGLRDARAWIARGRTGRRTGLEHDFLVVDRRGRILGACSLNQIRPEHRLANLGYWIRTSAAGQGIATAAVRKIAAFAFRETDLARLEIVVAVKNRASRRVAEKAGAICEGIARDRLFFGGRQQNAVMYVLLRRRGGRRRR